MKIKDDLSIKTKLHIANTSDILIFRFGEDIRCTFIKPILGLRQEISYKRSLPRCIRETDKMIHENNVTIYKHNLRLFSYDRYGDAPPPAYARDNTSPHMSQASIFCSNIFLSHVQHSLLGENCFFLHIRGDNTGPDGSPLTYFIDRVG